MKKNTAIYASTFCIILILITTAFTLEKNGGTKIDKFGEPSSCNSNEKSLNGTKVAYTQSAHDQSPSPGTCADCHGGGTSTPIPTITFTPALGSNNTYTPGTTYTISYTVTGYPKFGFDLEMNDGNTTTSMGAGTLSATTNTRYTATPSGGYPANISHSTSISTGTNATFKWVAPSVGTTVYLFSNALGVNGDNSDGNNNGDKEVFKNMVLNAIAGIETLSLNTEIKLFPNPAKETATLNYYLNKDSHVTINITDLNGKIVSTQITEDASEGSYSKKLELNELNSGTYFVKIKSDDNSVTKKLVVQ